MASPLALALMQGQSASGVPPANIAQVAPTNMVQATSDFNNAMEQSYQAQLQQQNAMWGGLAGLGSAGILAGAKYLGSPAATAATTAASAAPAAAATPAVASNALDSLMLGGGATGAPLSLAAPGAVADAVGAGDAAADAGATAAAAAGSGGLDLASLLALFA
jgi:hypothetical protein